MKKIQYDGRQEGGNENDRDSLINLSIATSSFRAITSRIVTIYPQRGLNIRVRQWPVSKRRWTWSIFFSSSPSLSSASP